MFIYHSQSEPWLLLGPLQVGDTAQLFTGQVSCAQDLGLCKDDFECPVCCDLLFKPVSMPCGHTLCFWCCFQSMNPFQPSSCPLCRSTYNHFSSPSSRFQELLSVLFPADFRDRKLETDEYEAEHASSVALPSKSEADDGADGGGMMMTPGNDGTSPTNLFLSSLRRLCLCENPKCIELLTKQPVILNCGHVLCCASCCSESTTTTASGSNVGLKCPRCQQITPCIQTQSASTQTAVTPTEKTTSSVAPAPPLSSCKILGLVAIAVRKALITASLRTTGSTSSPLGESREAAGDHHHHHQQQQQQLENLQNNHNAGELTCLQWILAGEDEILDRQVDGSDHPSEVGVRVDGTTLPETAAAAPAAAAGGLEKRKYG